jgi:hypothetical protein
MNKELQNKLFEKYPKIFVQKDLSPQETCMCWGISCGDGWYTLINELCADINNRLENKNRNKPEEEHLVCQAVQVKEKFGGLCFYIYGGDEYIDGCISMAESISYHICTECGNKSNSINDRGWIHSLCLSCQDSFLSKRADILKQDKLDPDYNAQCEPDINVAGKKI